MTTKEKALLEELETIRSELNVLEEKNGRQQYELENFRVDISDIIGIAEANIELKYRDQMDRMKQALDRISKDDCGCLPCRGQCQSQESLKIRLDVIVETAIEALKS